MWEYGPPLIVSHGELIRDGIDQTLTVDVTNLRFVFQGLLETDKSSKGYGQFPWRIGMLTPVDGDRNDP
jgi:endo-1,4-beta-xylanase